jgi:dTDP-4-amino-4,6-dideoxygalactose transaminase
MIIKNGQRDALKAHLEAAGIPAMIYYPVPLNQQEAYQTIGTVSGSIAVTEMLCNSVLSLPMHTELTEEQQSFITTAIHSFFNN